MTKLAGVAIAQGTFQELREALLADIDPETASPTGRALEPPRNTIELFSSE
jgi:hypothetical protein